MHSGDIVESFVYREENYGVFLKYEDAEIFVHLPEMSWTERAPANQLGLMNTLVAVKLIKYIEEKKQWLASIRKAHPENNPYVNLSKVNSSTVFDGKVFSVSIGDFFVSMEGGALGRISENPLNKTISVGDDVRVSVIDVDPQEGKMNLMLR